MGSLLNWCGYRLLQGFEYPTPFNNDLSVCIAKFPTRDFALKKRKKKSPNWDLPVDVIAYILEVPYNLICKSVLWELNEVSSTTVEEHWMLILYSESSLYLWLYEL